LHTPAVVCCRGRIVLRRASHDFEPELFRYLDAVGGHRGEGLPVTVAGQDVDPLYTVLLGPEKKQ
jgi:hypothetical protein